MTFTPCLVKVLIPLIIIVIKGNISNKTNPLLRTAAPQWGVFAWCSFQKNGLLTLSFPLLSLLQQNKSLPKQFAAWNIWQRWAVGPLWEAM